MKKIISLIIVSAFAFLNFSLANAQLVKDPQQIESLANETATAANLGNISVGLLVASGIKTALSFLAVIFLVITLFAGFRWMTAQGNEEQIKKASASIKAATIGLVIVLAAYTITSTVPRVFPSLYPQEANNIVQEVAAEANLTDVPVGKVVAEVIQVVLGFLAIIFLVLTLFAGFRWMTAQGNEEEIKKASASIKTAVIGLVIILAAYTITYFIFRVLPFGAGSVGGGGTSG